VTPAVPAPRVQNEAPKGTTSTDVVSATGSTEGGFLMTTLQAMVNWSRKNSVWPLPLGLSCCGIEFMATAASRYDMSRFGMEVARFSPRQADLLLVAGTLTYKMAHVMTRLYDQMAEPKWVVAMGACASSGGMFRSYPVVQGIDEFIPVDFYIPGCPPRPDAVLNCLLQLQKKIARDRSYRLGLRAADDAPLSLGGLATVSGRGEMVPPALATSAERWVEGSKPRAGADRGDPVGPAGSAGPSKP
jgi:NADH-quinone oxidoreductase subunit B